MAKDYKLRKEDEARTSTPEMTLEEAKAFRASLYRPQNKSLTDQEKREAFRVFWAKEKYKYNKSKELEQILWVHIKSVKLDDPEKFEEGVKHFGLQKQGN